MAYVRELVDADMPIRRTSELVVESIPGAVFEDAKTSVEKRARGQHAPQRIVDAVEAAATLPFAEGMAQRTGAVPGVHAGSTVSRIAAFVFRRATIGKNSRAVARIANARHSVGRDHRRRNDGWWYRDEFRQCRISSDHD